MLTGMSVVDDLREALDGLAALDPSTLSDDEVTDTVAALQQLQAQLDAARVRLTGVFDTRRVWQTLGARSAAVCLAGRTNAAPADLSRDVKLARRLRSMPHTREAFSTGAIGRRHTDMLARAHSSTRPPIAAAFPAAEEMLVGFARDMDYRSFEAALRYWLEITDPDGATQDADADFASRYLNLSQTLRDRWVIDGELDPVAGAEIAEALQRIYEELWAADWKLCRQRHGDQACEDRLWRTPTQRRADCLVEMARRASATPADANKPAPLVVIHLGDETLTRMCELASGRVIHPAHVIPHLGDADVQRITYAGASRKITELGTRTPFFSGLLREAIQHRDRHCTEPGCDQPAGRCQVDHHVPKSRGGFTSQTNGRTRCKPANRHKSNRLPDDWANPHYWGAQTPTERDTDPPLFDTG
jgi:Domain of unknown function (DUF222)